MAEIKYIAVTKLCPHPDNPRRDVGDVTELADSIKANGIYGKGAQKWQPCAFRGGLRR